MYFKGEEVLHFSMCCIKGECFHHNPELESIIHTLQIDNSNGRTQEMLQPLKTKPYEYSPLPPEPSELSLLESCPQGLHRSNTCLGLLAIHLRTPSHSHPICSHLGAGEPLSPTWLVPTQMKDWFRHHFLLEASVTFHDPFQRE